MVRSVSSETADSESNQNPYRQIVYEFYPWKSVTSKLTIKTLNLNLTRFIQQIILLNKKKTINASDRLRTTHHLILSFTYRKYRKFIKANPSSNISAFFSDPKLSPLFSLLLKVLFSQSPRHLCSKLKVRCCTSSNHFSFCKFKWRALQNYFIHELLTIPDTQPLSPNTIPYILSEIFHN